MYGVGQNVMVDMAGFSQGGVSFGSGASMGGVIAASNPDGTYQVQLAGSIGGVSIVTVGAGRLRPA
jgi:hypothetical protein